MTLDDFIAKYNGKYLEVAGSPNALNQCTDLANGYIREVLGLPIIEWTNAVDFPSKAGDKYDWIDNSPIGYPEKGDIVIFKQYGSLYGSAGHIAVVISADLNKMTVFEQNYPTGSKCRIGTHNYLGCRGWLVPKSSIISPQPPETMDYKAIFDKTGDLLPDRALEDDTYLDNSKLYADPTTNIHYATLTTDSVNKYMSLFREYRDRIKVLEVELEDCRANDALAPKFTITGGDNFTVPVDPPVEVKPVLSGNSSPTSNNTGWFNQIITKLLQWFK